MLANIICIVVAGAFLVGLMYVVSCSLVKQKLELSESKNFTEQELKNHIYKMFCIDVVMAFIVCSVFSSPLSLILCIIGGSIVGVIYPQFPKKENEGI